jgi:hypothetical protein
VHVFETPGDVTLDVKIPSGRVLISTGDEPRTTIDVVSVGRRGEEAADEVEVTLEERRGRYVVRIEQRDKFRWGPIQITWGGDFECRITCPRGSDLDLSGSSTQVEVGGELGRVKVKTASGDVHLDVVGDELEARTASGEISVGTIGADASLVTVSGDLRVQRVEAPVTARTVSGDLALGTIQAAVSVATTSGDVEIKSVAGGDIRVQTVSGDVRVGIAPGTRTWVDAASVSGRLESELGLDDHEPESLAADIPVVPLRAKTVSGDVSVVRAAASYSARG